jgi:hypothetical protein
MDEVMNERVDLIEHQLAHAVKDANGRAYNRTAHLPARREMMQRWADYLDKLRIGADVIPLCGNPHPASFESRRRHHRGHGRQGFRLYLRRNPDFENHR